MLAQPLSAAVRGVEGFLVRVEVHVATGLPSFTVVGLPQGEVREGKERVAAALRQIGTTVPLRRVTVNLAPADVRKAGSAFDLSIALGLAAANGLISADSLARWVFLGELGLDGSLRPVRGALAIAAACRRDEVRGLVLPRENALEAAAVEDLQVFGAGSLEEVLSHLSGRVRLDRVRASAGCLAESARSEDLRDVRGQDFAKRALEIAAAGGHNLLFVGPPGAGKTMLARRLSGILPPMSLTEALQSTTIHSVAGTLPPDSGLLPTRPFRAPHHTVSYAGLVGGGTPPRPGEASLAHHGVLFLDELPEFRRSALEALRQPMEEGFVVLARAAWRLRFPSRFTLVGAMNPCPCGFWGDGTERCTCDPGHVHRYRARVSGPLLDRIDLHVEVPPVPTGRLSGKESGPTSADVRDRVMAARTRQTERFRRVPDVHANAQMRVPDLRRRCRVGTGVVAMLQRAMDRLRLSARSYHRILKVARTIGDLEGSAEVEERHVAEAIQYRALDRGVGRE